ncbi:hypothetical protein QE370_002530 [Aeromicrobium sp. SORGH_AS981]|uniref:hypothetical protein n=1 Tax=Aeromicrobium sp. SORGH_AS_0981 TaxID=3041802 RepID=UPI0028551079|nr:hypothetical protein [Aeromicrobium sp. SORGH_AS_0981]MDR6119346.1 hypothetical protein [Aeromicrobium sp. SORGH_AS_0981]
MPSDVVVLVATAVLAVVTVVAAVVAVLAARRVARGPVPAVLAAPPAPPLEPVHEDVAGSVVPGELVRVERPRAPRTDLPASERSGALAPRVVEGRVVVPPTQDQVVAATLSRPQVRLAVVAEGFAHALRPESRDRISALVRREYRGRRRERLRAGRRAARAAHASALPTAPADQWLGER